MHYSTSNVYDILADQGATLNRALLLKNSTKRPVDISGYIGRMHIRDYVDSSIIVKTLTTENGGITIDGVTGRVDILVSGQADAVALARAFLYQPRWAWEAAASLGGKVSANARYWRCLPKEAQDIFQNMQMGQR